MSRFGRNSTRGRATATGNEIRRLIAIAGVENEPAYLVRDRYPLNAAAEANAKA